MPEHNKKFHEFALRSSLFKGRHDWYFCYLKTEKIAHVLTFISQQGAGSGAEDVAELARRAGTLSGEIVHLAAGEVDISIVLADVFALLSHIRILGVRNALSKEAALLLVHEYEAVAERLMRGSNPSPFLSSEDFGMEELPGPAPLLSPQAMRSNQGHIVKDNKTKPENKGQSDRMSLILDIVRRKRSVSIKGIAAEIKGCSEKTIQRELNILIEQGLVRREGERRWSVYVPV